MEIVCDRVSRILHGVGIATGYGLDGPGIESKCRSRFFAPVQGRFYTMDTECFPGVKRPGRAVDHPLPSTAEVEGRVELYICSPYALSWPVLE